MIAKAVAFILLNALLCLSSLGQSLIDVVHLKNGSIIRGIIVEQIPNESLKIQTQDGSVFVFQLNEVAKITKEFTEAQSKSDKESALSQYNRSGFVNHTSLGGGLGIGKRIFEYGNNFSLRTDNSDFYLRLETVNGFWVSDGFLSLGLGVGVEYFDHVQIPVYLDFRIVPLKGNFSPTLVLQGGYSIGAFDPDNNNSNSYLGNGPQVAGGLGFQAGISNGAAVNFGLLYDWRQLTYNKEVSWLSDSRSTMGFLRIVLGFSF